MAAETTRERALLVCGLELVSWLQGFVEGADGKGQPDAVAKWVADVYALFAEDADGR